MARRQEGSARREARFDAFELVAREGVVEGDVEPIDLPRIEDRLADDAPASGSVLHYRIAGSKDAAGRPALALGVNGNIALACQRCLQPFAFGVDQDTLVLLARDEDELAFLDDNDEHEVVLASQPLDAHDLVEDELLLSLPFVPRCERPDCVAGELPEAAQPAQDEAARSPFAALSALKRGGGAGEGH